MLHLAHPGAIDFIFWQERRFRVQRFEVFGDCNGFSELGTVSFENRYEAHWVACAVRRFKLLTLVQRYRHVFVIKLFYIQDDTNAV